MNSIIAKPIPDGSVTDADIKQSHLFKNTRFLRLWFGELLSHPAVHIVYFSIFLRMFELTDSNFMVSVLLAIISTAPILFSSLAGVLADHINRKWIMVAANFSRILIMLGLFFRADNVIAIFIAAFLLSTASNIYQPTENASVPSVAKPHQLFLANTIYMFTIYTAIFSGYALSGPFLVHLENKLFLVAAVLFFLGFLMNLTLPQLNSTHWYLDGDNVLAGSAKKTLQYFKEGVVFLKQHPVILLTVFQVVFIFSMERAIVAMVPDLVNNFLKISVEELSLYLISPLGIGALVGGAIGNMLKKRWTKRQIINTGLFLDSFAMLFMPLAWLIPTWLDLGVATDVMQLGIMGVLAFFSGLADVIIIISAQTLLHEQAGEGNRGRVVGNVFALMNLIGLPVILLVGAVSTYIEITWIIFTIGVLVLSASLLGFSWSKKLDKQTP